jgi:hypothetical protein
VPATGLAQTAGTVAAPSVVPAANTPTLAGIGSSTLAPTMPMPAAASAGPMSAPAGVGGPFTSGFAPTAGFGGGPLAGNGMGAGGMMPFMPAAGGSAAGGSAAGGGRKRRDRSTESDSDGRAGVPMVGMPPMAGGAGTRAGVPVRPGIARRLDGSPATAGVAAGLRGRGDQAGDTEAEGPNRRTAGTRRRRDEDRVTVQFLDEEAWQADVAVTGVVSAPETEEAPAMPAPSVAPAVRVG